MNPGCIVNIRNLILKILGQKYDFCRSGLMNARFKRVELAQARYRQKLARAARLGSRSSEVKAN